MKLERHFSKFEKKINSNYFADFVVAATVVKTSSAVVSSVAPATAKKFGIPFATAANGEGLVVAAAIAIG